MDVERGKGLGSDVRGGSSGIETVGRGFSVEAGMKVEGMPEDGSEKGDVAAAHQRTNKRVRFDKEGNPLISKGILIRKDIDHKYDIKAAILHVHKYQLVNDALIYYYEKVLSKNRSEKLKEAGVGELDL